MKLPKPAIRKARIEIIPMIDTIFFLLVFFMFSSLSMVQMRGMGVALPKAAPPSVQTPPPQLVVTVNSVSQYVVGTDVVPPETLKAAVQARVLADPRTVIIVNVDGKQPMQTLIFVMDAVNAVTTDGTPTGPPASVMIASVPIKPDGTAVSP